MPASRFFRVAHERLRAVFRKDTLDAELERELAFHFDHLVQEFVEGGLSAEEARHAARRTLGNIASLEEQCRDQRAVTWIHDLRRDLIYGIRMLRKHPAFTLVAVISLALGIGANTAIFSVMHAVLRERLPIPDDGRLVVLRTFPVDAPQQELHALLSEYFAWRDGNRSFDVMGVALGHQADFGADADGPRAERVGGQLVTADVFILLGVKPHLGRAFTEKEGRVGADDRVIVIGHRLWQRRYGGRPDIVGQVVRLDKVTWTIVGVMPDGFRYPNEDTDYWLPLRVDRSQPQGPRRFFVVTARLKPGVTPQQAQSDVGIISERLAREDPDRHAGWSVRVRPLREAMFGWSVAPLFTLQAAVALLLLVACANIAGLLLARSLVRMPEMALRSALGAGRGRIVRQLLTESVLLSAAGGVLGVLVAWVGIRGVVSMSPPPGSVGIVDIGVEPRTLVITALISIAAGMLFGLAPAVMGAGPRATAALKAPSGSAAMRFRGVLVVAQLAVTFVLLIGSGLLMKSFVQLVSRDLRFDPERLLTFEFHMPLSDYLKRQGTFEGLPYFRIDPPPSLTLERVRSAVGALPGVETVAGVSFPLINSVVLPSMAVAVDTSSGGMTSRAYEPSQGLAIGVGSLEDHVADRQLLSAAYFLVTPGFFTSIKAQLADGRDFSESDTATSRWVVIVNETAANRFWPGQRAVGRQLRLSSVPEERPREVVAVVRDIPFSRQGEIRPAVYAPYLQQPPTYPQPGANMFGRMTFMVRTTGDPMKLVPAVSHAVAGIDPDRPLSNVTTVEQQLRRVLPQRGYFAFAVTAFALVAMLLAGVGIYGVVSYSVAERTREIGIRLALGATRREVIRLVGRRALLVLALGLSLGLGGALMMTRLLQSQLWGVTPTDQTTFAAAIVLLVSAALAACVLPLRRALTVDPTVALRVE